VTVIAQDVKRADLDMAGRILIADGTATNRIVLKVRLAEARYETRFAPDGATCLRLSATTAPDVILLDFALPDIPGTEVLQRLRLAPATRDVPVVVIVSGGDPRQALAAFRAGADDVLTKPFDEQILMARLRRLMRAREDAVQGQMARGTLGAMGLAEVSDGFESPGRIALVTEHPETAMRWRRELGQHLWERMVLLSGDQALALAGRDGAGPDVYLIDSDLGAGGSGLRLMSDLRCRGDSRHAAICIVQAEEDAVLAAMAFDLGADDLVAPGVDPAELALRLRALLRRKRHADRLRASVENSMRLAMIDPLTGLYNRRFALAQLGHFLRASDAAGPVEGGDVVVMVIDLDRFKSVNDRWGHAAGDAVLAEVAARLAASIDDGDLLARIGGEEFLVALPSASLAEAGRRAERLRDAVRRPAVGLPGGGALDVTISIGLALAGQRGHGGAPDPVADLIDRADRALLTAKSEGRDQITFSRTAA
jgi:two-component system, cell cycle response regulator